MYLPDMWFCIKSKIKLAPFSIFNPLRIFVEVFWSQPQREQRQRNTLDRHRHPIHSHTHVFVCCRMNASTTQVGSQSDPGSSCCEVTAQNTNPDVAPIEIVAQGFCKTEPYVLVCWVLERDSTTLGHETCIGYSLN